MDKLMNITLVRPSQEVLDAHVKAKEAVLKAAWDATVGATWEKYLKDYFQKNRKEAT